MDIEGWDLVGAFALGIITCSIVGVVMKSVTETKPSFAPHAPYYRSDYRSFYHRR